MKQHGKRITPHPASESQTINLGDRILLRKATSERQKREPPLPLFAEESPSATPYLPQDGRRDRGEAVPLTFMVLPNGAAPRAMRCGPRASRSPHGLRRGWDCCCRGRRRRSRAPIASAGGGREARAAAGAGERRGAATAPPRCRLRRAHLPAAPPGPALLRSPRAGSRAAGWTRVPRAVPSFCPLSLSKH